MCLRSGLRNHPPPHPPDLRVGEALEEVRLHGQLVADLLGVGMDFAVLVAQEVEVTLVEVAGAADVEAVGALE